MREFFESLGTTGLIILGASAAAAVALIVVIAVVIAVISKRKKARSAKNDSGAQAEEMKTYSEQQNETAENTAEEQNAECAEAEAEAETEAEVEAEAEAVNPDVSETEAAEQDIAEVIKAEEKIDKAVDEFGITDEDDENEFDDGDENDDYDDVEVLRGIEEDTGLAIVVRYKKSFLAKVIQSSDTNKKYYSDIKNHILSYIKTKSRVSWNYDSYNSGRNKLCKLVMRGKTLCLYLALDPDAYAESKYKVERSKSKKYEETPCLYRIKNPRRAKFAEELISELAAKFGLEAGERQNVDYYMPYETTEALVEKELIKELVSKEKYEEFMRRRSLKEVDKNRRKFVSAAEVNAILEDEVAITLIDTEPELKESEVAVKKRYRKKSIVNIDKLSAEFQAGQTVTLKILKEKEIVSKDTDFVKVLARGTLDKPLKVEAQDYSVEAVKMILLTGGKVKKVR